MPNLNLTHRGNMNITSVNLTSAGTLDVRYEPNNTGAVTGFSFTPQIGSEFVCGDTYTITAIPKFSGNVLTETFTVSGADIAGVLRSDNSVLRQGYDSDLTHYELNLASVGATIISSSVTNAYLELEISIDSNEYAEIDIQPGSGDIIVYPIDNITGGDVPIVLATSVTIVVDSAITDSGFATSTYSPDNATVQMTYSSSNPDLATIDPNTGEITVLANGEVEFCVTDSVSNLSDCKTVTVEKSEEPGTTGITALTLSITEDIVETGIAVPIYSSPDEEVSFVFTSSNPSLATIDSEGNITVLGNGEVTFCVKDEISGLEDCKTVLVRKAVYINDIEIVVADEIIMTGVATATYTPTAATVSLVYSSSNPSIATIDPITGEITVNRTGDVTFCVRDIYTNLSDCKNVSAIGTEGLAEFVYNVTSTSEPTLLFSNDSCCGDHWSDFSRAIYYNGVSITPNTKSYTFPETGEQTIYVDFKTYEESGRTLLNNCIFRDNTKLVKAKFPADYNVQATGNYTFYGCTNLREADLSCFTEIDYGCFYGCTSLSSITIPNVEIIGESSFINTGLKNVYGPKVKTIFTLAFKSAEQLETAVFPSLVTLSRWAFQLSTLQEFTVARTVETIGADAFDECYCLRNITFESPTVKSGWSAFGRRPVDNLVNLFNVWVPYGSETAYKNWLSGYAGCGTSVKCRENVNTLTIPVTFYRGDDESGRRRIMSDAPTASDGSSIGTLGVISIKDSNGKEVILEGPYDWKGFGWYSLQTGDTVFNITFDADYMAANGLGNLFVDSNIKNFNMPGSWDSGVCFSGCTQLQNLVLQDGCTTVPEKMCTSCSKLSSVVLPNSVTSIGNSAFESCPMLDAIVIPNGVTSIGNFAFYGAHLSSVVIPDSVTTIGEGAFRNNNSPTIDIGSGIRSIGNNAFPYATSVTIRAANAPSIAFDANNPFRSSANEGTYPIYVQGDKFYTYANWGVRSAELQSRIQPISAPTTAETRLVCTFYSSSKVTTRIVNSDSLSCFTKAELANGTSVNMNSYTFQSGWTTIYFTLSNPRKVGIGNEIFTYNTNSSYPRIRMIFIPASVEQISSSAFIEQSSILCVSVGPGVSTIGNSAFAHTNISNPSTYYWFFDTTPPTLGTNAIRPTSNMRLNYPCGSNYSAYGFTSTKCFTLT